MVRRSTAKVGDCLLVTGTIGDSALALVLLRNPELLERWPVSAPMAAYLSTRYLLPEPRSALAEAIRLHASAAMDVSDGLAGDVAKLARASSLAVEIDVSCVPLSDAARAVVAAVPEVIETLLTGGDDYEIILTLAPEKLPAFRAAAQVAGVPVSEIGRMQAGEGARFIRDGNALAFARSSYSHF
jgi:thiamine-monophosphate kinase